MLEPPPNTSMWKFSRMPRSAASTGDDVESPPEYDIIPSISFGVIPASAIALRIAHVPR